ncbi:hypothetical protein Ddye_029162 [Dipteronia dyeriana]|uniref:RNase H type-1 domain-containing protein n=1 Tax=Dipteronia dyeriana TaxID=168575 RepID=A0AAD9TDV5_9ROSI|nr:hypothetical protein Ddye_029162 [Dipteronia dyeriana]
MDFLPNGCFTVKSFRKCLEEMGGLENSACCPPLWFGNVMVFGGKVATLSTAFDSVKFRVTLWFKNCGAGSNEDVSILLLDVERRCIDRIHSKRKNIRPRSPPNVHDLVFYVDGSSRDNPRVAGIRGVLRDTNGKFLCLFYFCVGVADSNFAEVLAIRRACALISSHMYLMECKITILNDSINAVSWINNGGFGHINLVNVLYDIKQFLTSMSLVSIEHTTRSCNSLADGLAKDGSGL